MGEFTTIKDVTTNPESLERDDPKTVKAMRDAARAHVATQYEEFTEELADIKEAAGMATIKTVRGTGAAVRGTKYHSP